MWKELEQAHEGTIFLDEIGEISINLQSRLLRVIQERKVRRLGDNKLTHVDVRVVASTNKDLYSLIECNTFREDLYYRINVLNINLPPLRARKIDIPLLANYFVRKYTHKFKIVIEGISKEGTQLLMNYNWPGNIRQLENIIERLMVKTKEGYITAKNVKFVLKSLPGSKLILGIDDGYGFDTPQKSIRIPLMGSLEDIERTIIEKVIQKENGNKTAAAEKLGIGRTTLWRKINNN